MLHLTNKELQELSDKWLSGAITKNEREKLEQWYNQESPDLIDWVSADVDENSLRERLFKGIKKSQKEGSSTAKVFKISHARKVAATVFFLMAFGLIYWLIPFKKNNVIANNDLLKKAHPNINKAILTLADGSKVVLDNTRTGMIAHQGNVQIDKADSGKLVYHAKGKAINALETKFNSVSTPVGSQYQVSLSDGSKVWLNALSTIKYPTAFTGKERVVELTGEAYFEVEKNKTMPFKVMLANHTSVEVLGTHFDIMAYTDEKDIDATLLEGSIKVTKGEVNKTITPGEQAKITDNIKVSNVNAEEAIAWKKGLFSFDRSDTETIMRQIGRWYGVDIAYQGKVPDNQLTGYIARTSNLPEVLKMLEVSGLKSTLKNNKITIIN